VERLAEGLEFFSRPRSAWKFTVSSLIYWGLSVLSVWVLLIGSAIHASFAQAGVVLGVLTLGLLVPGAPGFFGIFQMSAYAGLSLYLAPQLVRDSGSVFVFWLYVIQFTVSLVPAVWAIPVSSRTLAAATLPVAQSATSQESDRPEV